MDRWMDRRMDTGKKQMGDGREKERESWVSRGQQQLLMISGVAKRQRDRGTGLSPLGGGLQHAAPPSPGSPPATAPPAASAKELWLPWAAHW